MLPPLTGNSTISPTTSSLLFRSLLIEHYAVPTIHYVEMNVKLIDHAHGDVIDHVVKVLGVIIKGRHRRENHNAHPRQLQHVLKMYFVEIGRASCRERV